MSGFTAGPWFWENDVLCNKDFIVGGREHSFKDGNKQLIAAAPELLEALQALIYGYERRSGDGLFDMVVSGEDVERAVKAINKALGQ